jgi:hypothetical protein
MIGLRQLALLSYLVLSIPDLIGMEAQEKMV